MNFVVKFPVPAPEHAAFVVHVVSLARQDAVPLTMFNYAGRRLAKQIYVHPDDADVQAPSLATRG